MLRIALRSASAFGLLLAVSSLATAQERPVPVQTTTTRTGTVIRTPRSILGARVSLQGGTGVGTVEDVVIDDDGRVEYLVVSNNGQLVTVPWEAAKYDYRTRVVSVPVTQEQYRRIPTYTTERYPNFYTPEYRTQVYRYYGLTPGERRRLERRP